MKKMQKEDLIDIRKKNIEEKVAPIEQLHSGDFCYMSEKGFVRVNTDKAR